MNVFTKIIIVAVVFMLSYIVMPYLVFLIFYS